MEPSIPSIPGIDGDDLMERIGGDSQLFWEVLRDFSSTCRDHPAQIAAALGPDPAGAKHLSHTLKGVLGNLGATGLFNTCKELDDAIREGHAERYPELLAALGREVPALCDAIERAYEAQAADAPAEPAAAAIGSDWLALRYRALREALVGHRARDCKTLADEIGASALPAAEQPFFDTLQSLVRTYRFKDAQALLDRRLDL